ncbi:NAD-dependent epimerase/dehydratase family protein [Brochothrix thermosphacta]|uniref:NAD-dependent epimerase/dehydratase family protein n=1 Tax=Brochothrix thermosphacta TaxID=2756 RepID=UPI000D79D410|nr:NAD-dependent epimerase/dehydratase family protein [Brochothrix thermosphacta]SPN75509.1 hypothetical protein BTEBP_220003 [Brochothrix thermosphacta]
MGDVYSIKERICVRDYIYVSDLIDALILALDDLIAGGEHLDYNLGNGQGFIA